MDDELYHHGVKGQKWGVRRTKAQLGYKTTSSAKKKTTSKSTSTRAVSKKTNSWVKNYLAKRSTAKKKASTKNEQEADKPKKKSVSEMSDAELREKISRLQMEKQYKELTASSKQNSRGKKFVMNVLEKSGENLATQVVNHYGATALNKMIGQEVIYANNKKKA